MVCIPFTLFVQYVAYKQSVSRLVKLTLIPIIAGVGYATIYDLSLNPVGLGYSSIIATKKNNNNSNICNIIIIL